jgi:hypothetical protein
MISESKRSSNAVNIGAMNAVRVGVEQEGVDVALSTNEPSGERV